MRILVRNYTSTTSTQSQYLTYELQKVPNVEAGLWNGEGSLYDAFDQFKPDLLITHGSAIRNDLVSYLKDVDTPHLKLAICLNGMSSQSATELEELLRRLNLADNVAVYYSSRNHQHLPKLKKNVLPLMEAADEKAVSQAPPPYHIETCVVVDRESEAEGEYGRSYHFVSSNPELQDKVDIVLPCGQLAQMFKNYDRVIIKYPTSSVTQHFFDAVLAGGRPVFHCKNAYAKEQIGGLCQKLFGFSCVDGEEVDHEAVRKIVLEKHMPANRVKTLISQLPINQRFFEL